MGVLTQARCQACCRDASRRQRAWLQQSMKSWWESCPWHRVARLVLVLFTFRDYGVTWDEDAHNWYGNFVLDYYLSLFRQDCASLAGPL